MADDAIGEPILIRFDGLDADKHEIEMSALADSLGGIARIIAVSGNFAATMKFVQHKDAMAVRVVARPPEAHCFEMWATVKWASEHPLIATTVGGLFVVLVSYIFKRAAGQREEMRHLREALDAAIKELGTRDQQTVDRLLTTVDKMADALRPAAKQAVKPIGTTARSLTIGSVDRSKGVTLDAADKAAITADDAESEVDVERTYFVKITELDMESGACRVAFPGDDGNARISGRITDPAFSVPNNPYALAMASVTTLGVRAKAMIKDGQIDKLFISNTATSVSDTEQTPPPST
jgi:hypothetical protein